MISCPISYRARAILTWGLAQQKVSTISSGRSPQRPTTPQAISPFHETARSSRILVQLTDDEYVRAYRAAKKSASRRLILMNKADWTRFTMHKVPALTSVMTQVTRWLIPSPKRTGLDRGEIAYELEDVLSQQYFDQRGFSSDAATGLISLVSELIWEEWETFSVKQNPK